MSPVIIQSGDMSITADSKLPAMPATPTRLKKRLGRQLRKLREHAGVTLRQAALELRTTDSSVSKYESGVNRPQWPTVKTLLSLYEASDEDRARVQVFWDEAATATPYIRLPAGASKMFRQLVRSEGEASTVRTIAPSVVPGLLQTADYARAVHASAQRSREPKVAADEFVAQRLNRQKRLIGPDPLHLHALLDEVVLHRLVGDKEVMRGQLEHLLRAGEMPNVRIQVLPYDIGAYGSMAGTCYLFGYEDPEDQAVAYLEHAAGGVWIEDGEDVQHLSTMFDSVSADALSPEDSAEFIRAKVGIHEEGPMA
ncbi:helix-turn-helix domain-containing protein [Amycolatopsis sp. CA-230715]|uniref:helix-turn-helix domain-containing protein n=1 Tax=Amycolatopsis sp. CA-230715 TaxID=2745196 RepID=UPI001C009301|nr:helix-turn-helix transcriptional regulator [Amycolatopsis sp. CA-230715]